jgi:sec-independent protein translocase protein TatA
MPFIGNIGPGELLLLLIIILVIFGPGRLPEIGQAVGKGIREFRKASSDITEATRLDASPAQPSATPAPTPPMAGPAGAPPSPVAPPVDDDASDVADEAPGDASRPSA